MAPSHEELDMDRRENRWMLDKHIPVGVLLAILIQTASFVWYAAKIDSRIADLERRRQEDATAYATLPARMIQMEIEQKYSNQLLNRIASSVQELENNSRKDTRK